MLPLAAMGEPLAPSAQRVSDMLARLGLAGEVVELPATTRSAADAARAIGCDIDQIAKTIVFKTSGSGRAVLVVASGSHRIDERRLAEVVGEDIELAKAEFVREATGFAIGGVPPLPASGADCMGILDEGLLEHEQVWAAAGTPHAVFKLDSSELEALADWMITTVSA